MADAATIARIESELEEVRAAISEALTAQSWQVGGRAQSQARLAELEARESRLELKLARAKRGGIRMRQAVPRG